MIMRPNVSTDLAPAAVRAELSQLADLLRPGAYMGGAVGQAGNAVLFAVPGGVMGSGQINASGATWREALDNLRASINEWIAERATESVEAYHIHRDEIAAE